MARAREPSSQAARNAVAAFAARGGAADDPEQKRAVVLLAEHAPPLLGHVLSEPALLEDVLARPLERPSGPAVLRSDLARLTASAASTDGHELRRALRRLRHRGIVRIALRELSRVADVEETSAEMSHLASVLVDAALQAAIATESARHGVARDASGEPIALCALGMGKLGGLELNLGSDIDLCFFYETDEASVEGGELSVHELYTRVVRRAVAALSEVTEDGFCFRVDLRLRPEGTRGPLINSLASAERYYESWGRTWERAALLRARPIAGELPFGERLLAALRPFVFRRKVDPSLATQMAEMLTRSRRELNVDLERDIKLGRGGIREAEFFVQTLQLIWGGQHEGLAVPGTLEALRRLETRALVQNREAQSLRDAWAVLRRIEHRIHVRAGYQTHSLPTDRDELAHFAASLGYARTQELQRALDQARAAVEQLFASLLPTGGHEEQRFDALLDLVAHGASADGIAEEVEKVLTLQDAFEAAGHLARLARRADAPLGAVSHERLPQLGRMLLDEIAGAPDPDMALRFLAEFFVRLGGPWPYERLLLERPRVTRRLIGLFGASGTLASALIGHPEEVDMLLSSATPNEREIAADHDRLEEGMDDDPDPEVLVPELRRLKRELTLRIGLAYVAGELDVREAAERLSEIAEGQARVSLSAATRWAQARWGRPSSERGLVVCAMGKLGARELGFGGDLDLVFLYGEDGETRATKSGRTSTHSELFTRIAQRTMLLLRQRDAEGEGYETDTRLRPSGSKGTLVVSLAAFDRYHERGAAAWERQALIRARPVAGDARVAAETLDRFAALAYGGDPTPHEELAHARARIQRELAGETRERYHPKLGYGGLTDVEFLVQWLQMRHGADARVRTPSTLKALSALAENGYLDEAEAAPLRDAYLFFRAVEQSLKLFDEHREPLLEPRGRTGAHVARSLGLHAKDGMSIAEVLDEQYRRHANLARRALSRVANVDAPAPWIADS